MAPVRSRSGTGTIVRMVAVGGGLAAGAALVAFHVWLLWLRATAASMLDAKAALRWGLSALLLGGLVALERRGLSPLQGQTALAFWVLVAVLHSGAIAPETRVVALDSETAVEVLFLLPSPATPMVAGAFLVWLCGRRARQAPVLAFDTALPFAGARALRARGGAAFAARPPPA